MFQQNVGRLPVVERNNPTRIVGYLGRSSILSARMRLHEEEHVRQRG
jgi:CIC family chloride channel protein